MFNQHPRLLTGACEGGSMVDHGPNMHIQTRSNISSLVVNGVHSSYSIPLKCCWFTPLHYRFTNNKVPAPCVFIVIKRTQTTLPSPLSFLSGLPSTAPGAHPQTSHQPNAYCLFTSLSSPPLSPCNSEQQQTAFHSN